MSTHPAAAGSPLEADDFSAARALERQLFKQGNRYIMTPLLRRGLGRWMSTPLTGYFMLLQTTGRKSRLPRLTPLNYAVDAGCIVCLAGFGDRADWLANVRHDPRVQVRLTGREFNGHAVEVPAPAEAARLAVRVARASGFALIFEHPRCLWMNDEQLAAHLMGRPVVRIQPDSGPVLAGPNDPGGYGWLIPTAAQIIALTALFLLSRARHTFSSLRSSK
ncbi:MAG: nitroreductase family deazaflavin-dependent oxidoreductase [Anaerolineae bacterium]